MDEDHREAAWHTRAVSSAKTERGDMRGGKYCDDEGGNRQAFRRKTDAQQWRNKKSAIR